MLKKNSSISITLFIFSIVAASSVIIVYLLTKPMIMFQKEYHQKIILDTILPKNLLHNTATSCFIINHKLLGDNKNHRFWIVKKNNKIKAVIFETIAPDGYSGNIKMIVSSDLHNKILGVRILDHHETPGLGDKIDIQISDWITKFSGVVVLGLNDSHFSLKKYGGNIDQFTGATITPLAVVNAIKRTVSLVKNVVFKDKKFDNCSSYYE